MRGLNTGSVRLGEWPNEPAGQWNSRIIVGDDGS